MNKRSIGFRLVDALLILMMILPLVGAMALQVLTKPASDGVAIAGARIFFTVHMPIQDLPITESQVNTWLIMISLFFLCLFFGGVRERYGRRSAHLLVAGKGG